MDRRALTTLQLGVSQTLAWASSYYLIAIIGPAMAQAVGMSTPAVYGAFSISLLVAAAVGPYAGKAIDRLGGRPVLLTSNVIFVLGLACLALAHTPLQLIGGWAVVGAAMGCGLYEAAFATAVRLYGKNSRAIITGITLVAGFASTIGWPLTTWLTAHYDWRGACACWAVLHIVLAMPLNATLPRPGPIAAGADTPAARQPTLPPAHQQRVAIALAAIFAATWFISTAMAAHLPLLLRSTGASLAAAIGAAALVGPAQVAGRIAELTLLRKAGPLTAARLAATCHPLAALMLLLVGAPAVAIFAILHGLGNGIMTVAIGTLPLVFFGPDGYGRRQGILMIPSRVLQAAAPFLFGVALGAWSTRAILMTACIGLFSLLLLCFAIRQPASAVQRPEM